MSAEKNKKKHSKLKIAGLVLFLLVLMAGVALFVYFMVREQNRAASFETAVASFNEQDYPKANRLFLQVVSYDKNNEKAYMYLAKIAQEEGHWEREAEYWRQCMQLNQLEESYKELYCKALARGRNFTVLATQFRQEFMKNAKLSDEHTFFCLLSNGVVKGWKATEDYRKNLQEKQPDFFKSEYGRCLSMLIDWSEGKEPDEAIPTVFGSGFGFIAVHTRVGPAGVLLDQVAVIADLR